MILSTVDKKGIPNAIYATCVRMYNDITLVVADNYLDKTRQKILDGSQTSILFITGGNNSNQVKGKITFHTSEEIFNDMKT